MFIPGKHLYQYKPLWMAEGVPGRKHKDYFLRGIPVQYFVIGNLFTKIQSCIIGNVFTTIHFLLLVTYLQQFSLVLL